MAATGDRARARRELDRFDLFSGSGRYEPLPVDRASPSFKPKNRQKRERELDELLDELEAELRRDLTGDDSDTLL